MYFQREKKYMVLIRKNCKNINLENKKEFLYIKNVIVENRVKFFIYCDWKLIDNVKIYDNSWRCFLSMLFGNMQ